MTDVLTLQVCVRGSPTVSLVARGPHAVSENYIYKDIQELESDQRRMRKSCILVEDNPPMKQVRNLIPPTADPVAKKKGRPEPRALIRIADGLTRNKKRQLNTIQK